MNETADGMHLGYSRVEDGSRLAGSSVHSVNRAWLREGARPRAILENSGPVSIPATAAIPVNSAPTTFVMAGQEPILAVAAVKWDNSLTAYAGSLPQEVLVNTGLQKGSVRPGTPIDGAIDPRGWG